MVCQAMGSQWSIYIFRLLHLVFLILLLGIQGCLSLSSEGLALLKFRAEVSSDPFGALADWNLNDTNPCSWSGVHCVDGIVQMLDLSGLSLEGILVPELGNLSGLRYLVLSNNLFTGIIPKELGQLSMLELLDLRNNNLSGVIPAEIGELHSLNRLLLSNNKLEGSIPFNLANLSSLFDVELDEKLTYDVSNGIGCINRKLARWFKHRKGSSDSNADYCNENPPTATEPHVVQSVRNFENTVRRQLFEQASNLAAIPVNDELRGHIIALPSSRSSGSFPATPSKMNEPPPHPNPPPPHGPPAPITFNAHGNSSNTRKSAGRNSWKYIIGISTASILLIASITLLFVCQSKAARNITPWKTGLSGKLQKAFVTGVPKLNRTELETACEDFSNIVITTDGCTIYKGTLSNGVEIAVASTSITSIKDWSKRSERAYRRKIDTLSRVNHKNFLNLIGHCEEDEPFVRMMVFEYAPNGSLYEHLHVKECEHLDWATRMRIVMGAAYFLQYLHGLNPPLSHPDLNSNAIFLTDDYAAKVGEIAFWKEFYPKSKFSGEGESEHSVFSPMFADPETNVYHFGILLLEVISGKVPYSNEQGQLASWAAGCLCGERNIAHIIDPTLTSLKDNEVDVICEVIRECTQSDVKTRPAIHEVISKMRKVVDVSPELATPRLSPLWWAELEILSAESA